MRADARTVRGDPSVSRRQWSRRSFADNPVPDRAGAPVAAAALSVGIHRAPQTGLLRRLAARADAWRMECVAALLPRRRALERRARRASGTRTDGVARKAAAQSGTSAEGFGIDRRIVRQPIHQCGTR